MEKIRIGVLGGYRGTSMINCCKQAKDAQIVAICDFSKEVLDAQREIGKDYNITFYDNFDDFIEHDMDAVVLANYANEHAPFAIKAMKKGKHVLSEVLPCQTMKEAVDLVETVEETGKIYAYCENYCYMPVPKEMKKLYRENRIGEFEYGECEYIHNCEPIWPSITYGNKKHWRNNMYSTFYCTHSIGPILHITGLRPVSVIGIESTKNERNMRIGARSGLFGIEMITLENGGIIKSIHGHLYKNSIWYSIYGSKGRMESGRESGKVDAVEVNTDIHIDNDLYSGGYETSKSVIYDVNKKIDDDIKKYGHGGSDYYTVHNFIKKIKGEESDIIDVYEALDMFLPGMFAYFSILDGNKPKEIPNLRNKEERNKWRNFTVCQYPEIAGEKVLPCCSVRDQKIDDLVYDHMKELWEKELNSKELNYRRAKLGFTK